MFSHVILYETSLLLVCLLGDYFPVKVSGNHGNLWRAFIDSLTHGGVGFLSWAVLIQARNFKDFWECGICGIAAMVIDADHFTAAQSFSLKAALSLRSRPFLHSTTFTLMLCLILFITGYTLNKGWIKLLSVMCFVAWTSHHVSDGSRRGLWFPPFGSTPLIPYKRYLTITLVLPLVVMFMVHLCDLDFIRVLKLQRHLFKEAKLLLPV